MAFPDFPWHQYDAFVFERGVSLSKESADSWRYQSSQGNIYEKTPAAVRLKFNLRPILASLTCGGIRTTLVMPATQGRFLDIYRSELNLKLSSSLSFLMGAILYHCTALSRWYAETCNAALHFQPKPNNGRFMINREEPYFEFEALITTIVRGYDTLRYPLWKKWGSRGGCPSSFIRALKDCQSLPSDLNRRLQLGIDKFLAKAKEYRDCIQHYVALGSTRWEMLELLQDSVWSLNVGLPHNPEARASDSFDFHNNLDALTFAWELSTEFFVTVDIVIGSGSLCLEQFRENNEV